jgi:ferredoxin
MATSGGIAAMTYVIVEACIGVKDRACVDVCPVDCIYEGEDMLYIHPDECIDCGACEPECPVTAIFPEEDVPPNMTSYIEKNRDVFNSDTPPGRPQR